MVDHNSYHNQARALHNRNLLDCPNKEKKKNPNSKLIITVTFFLMFFPWSICINNQFKKGKTILLSNNLSSVIFF